MTPLRDVAEWCAWLCADERPDLYGAWSDEIPAIMFRGGRSIPEIPGRPGQSRRDSLADAETLRAYDFARTSPKAAQLYTADWRGRSAAEHMQCAIEDGIFIGPRRPMSGRYAGFEPYASGYWGARYAAKAAFRAVPGLRGRR